MVGMAVATMVWSSADEQHGEAEADHDLADLALGQPVSRDLRRRPVHCFAPSLLALPDSEPHNKGPRPGPRAFRLAHVTLAPARKPSGR